MWARNKAPPVLTDGKVKREVAMTEQAELVLRKKAEIEAKMAAVDKIVKNNNTERKEKKPLSLSVNKRWGLKGKKGPGGGGGGHNSGPASVAPPSSLLVNSQHKSSISFNISTTSSLNFEDSAPSSLCCWTFSDNVERGFLLFQTESARMGVVYPILQVFMPFQLVMSCEELY